MGGYPFLPLCTVRTGGGTLCSRSVRIAGISRAARAAGTAGIIRAIRVVRLTGIVKIAGTTGTAGTIRPILFRAAAFTVKKLFKLLIPVDRPVQIYLPQAFIPWTFILRILILRAFIPQTPIRVFRVWDTIIPFFIRQSYPFLRSRGILAVPCRAGCIR